MDAEILSIGHELLMGEIVDTNSAYLAAQLPQLGIHPRWISTVGDDTEQLTESLRRAWARSSLTLTTGGLGPTMDDLTREAIARVFGEKLYVDSDLKNDLEAQLRLRGIGLSTSNLRQATRIPSAVAIPNTEGTAPGWWVERDNRILVALPGPPRELEVMWKRQVVPRLRDISTGTVISTRTLKTFGLSEAVIDEMVASITATENPYIGIYAKPDGIWLRLIAKAASKAAAQNLLDPKEKALRDILGTAIWGVDEETPEEQIGIAMTQKKLTLASMESCTGGLLASLITQVPGSSSYFRGGAIAYTNEAKVALGVSQEILSEYGSVSKEAALSMAETIRCTLNADIGLSVTGVAGPQKLEGHPVMV